jgi:hypothetical protein
MKCPHCGKAIELKIAEPCHEPYAEDGLPGCRMSDRRCYDSIKQMCEAEGIDYVTYIASMKQQWYGYEMTPGIPSSGDKSSNETENV